MRKNLHYDWHWVWPTGNGDLGNQGIHQMDIARWVLGEDALSPRVLSVGADPRSALLGLGQQTPGVDVTGYVPDPRPWFAEAWFGIVPLQSGAGLKIKVIEFLAQGLPVVTTTIGSEGITAQGEDGLIVSDTTVGFARHCIVLLGDRAKCRSLGQAAHRWFTTSYQPQEFGPDGVRKLVLGYA